MALIIAGRPSGHFFELDQRDGIDDAVDRYKKSLEELEENPGQMQLRLTELIPFAGQLTAVLTQRFEHFGDTDDIEQAVELQRQAAELALTHSSDPALQIASMVHLGRALTSQFEHTGDQVDHELAAEHLGRALSWIPDDTMAHAVVLGDFAKALWVQYLHFGNEADLDTSLDNCQKAIDRLPIDSLERILLSSVYGQVQLARFQQSRVPDDIDSALLYLRAAVDQSRRTDLDRPKRLSHYADALLARFQVQRNAIDLQQAITAQTQALNLLDRGSVTLPEVSGSLGLAFHTRYEHFGHDTSDLDSAIDYFKTAVELTPFSNLKYARLAHQMGQALISKYMVTQDVELLNQAVMLHQQAVSFTPNNSRQRLERFKQLGYVHSRRFRLHKDPQRTDDRNAAINAFMEALDIIGGNINHPEYSFLVSELDRIGYTVP